MRIYYVSPFSVFICLFYFAFKSDVNLSSVETESSTILSFVEFTSFLIFKKWVFSSRVSFDVVDTGATTRGYEAQ